MIEGDRVEMRGERGTIIGIEEGSGWIRVLYDQLKRRGFSHTIRYAPDSPDGPRLLTVIEVLAELDQ